MIQKARAAYRALCAAGPAPHALPGGSAPSTARVPLTAPRRGWAGLGLGLGAQLSLAGWPQSREPVRTSPPQALQDPAPGPAAIKSGCREQVAYVLSWRLGQAVTLGKDPGLMRLPRGCGKPA